MSRRALKMASTAWAAIRGLRADMRELDHRLSLVERRLKADVVAESRAAKRAQPRQNGGAAPSSVDEWLAMYRVEEPDA